MNKLDQIVSYMVKEGTFQTDSSHWIIDFEDLTERFNVTYKFLTDNFYNIITLLEQQDEIEQVDSIYNNGSFSIYFYEIFCPNVEHVKLSINRKYVTK